MTRDWLIARRGTMSIDALSKESGVPKIIISMIEEDSTVITSPNFIVKLAPFYQLSAEEFNTMVHPMWAVDEVPPPDTRFNRDWDNDMSMDERAERAKAAFLGKRPGTIFKTKHSFTVSDKRKTPRGVYRNGVWMSIRDISAESGIPMEVLYERHEKGAHTYEDLTASEHKASPEHLQEIREIDEPEKKPAAPANERRNYAMPRTDLGRKAVITIPHEGKNLTLREVAESSGVSYTTVRRRYDHGYRSYGDLTRFHVDRPEINPDINWRFKIIITLDDGHQMTLKDISEESGISKTTLQKRYQRGARSYEELTAPIHQEKVNHVREDNPAMDRVEKIRMIRRAKDEARREEELEKRRKHLERLNKLKLSTPSIPKNTAKRRLVHLIEYNGKMYTIGEIADALGYSRDTLYKRMRAGATTFDELTKGLHSR